MKNITIDIVTQNDIRISIDGEKIENIASFTLKVKDNQQQKYSFGKKVFENQQKEVKNNTIPKVRSVPEAVKELKNLDSKTAITQSSILELIKQNKISSVMDGRVKKVNVDEIIEYYAKGGNVTKPNKTKKSNIQAIDLWGR